MIRRTAAETQNRLINAARQAFAAVGFERAPTSSIAAAAGCSEPTLFKHFGSKTGLLVAVLRDAGDRVLARLEQARVSSAGDFPVFATLACPLLGDPLFGEMARLRSFALTRADDPDVRAVIDENVAGFDRLLDAVLAAGQAGGTVRPDVPPAVLRELILGMLLAAGFRRHLAPEPESGRGPQALLASLLVLIRPAPTEGNVSA